MGILDAHSRRLDIQRNLLIRVEQNLGEGFVAEHLLEDHTSIQCDLFAFVAREGSKDDVRLAAEVLYGGPPGAYLPAKEVIEYLGDILARFKLEASDIGNKMLEEISGVGFLSELCNQFGLGIYATTSVLRESGTNLCGQDGSASRCGCHGPGTGGGTEAVYADAVQPTAAMTCIQW